MHRCDGTHGRLAELAQPVDRSLNGRAWWRLLLHAAEAVSKLNCGIDSSQTTGGIVERPLLIDTAAKATHQRVHDPQRADDLVDERLGLHLENGMKPAAAPGPSR